MLSSSGSYPRRQSQVLGRTRSPYHHVGWAQGVDQFETVFCPLYLSYPCPSTTCLSIYAYIEEESKTHSTPSLLGLLNLCPLEASLIHIREHPLASSRLRSAMNFS